MCRLGDPPTAGIPLVPILNLDGLREEVKLISANHRSESARPAHPRSARKVRVGYDEHGRFVPRDAAPPLSAKDLKELGAKLNSINASLDGSPPLSVPADGKIFTDFSQNIVLQLIGELSFHWEMGGRLFRTVWMIVSKLFDRLVALTERSRTQSKELMQKSISEMQELSHRVHLLHSKPPIIIEKDVIVEKFIEKPLVDQTHLINRDLESAAARNQELAEQLKRETRAKSVWQSAALDLCQLSQDSRRTLIMKQKTWARVGQLFVSNCETQLRDLLSLGNSVCDKWGSECIQIYTLSFKAQLSVLTHLGLIQIGAGEHANEIRELFIAWESGKLPVTEFHQEMVSHRLPLLSQNLHAWSVVITQWLEMESTPVHIDAVRHSSDLEADFAHLLKIIQRFSCPNLLPPDACDGLIEASGQMSKLLVKVTKTSDDDVDSVLAGISSTFREWHRWTQEVLRGKANVITTPEGELNPLSFRTLYNHLKRAHLEIGRFVEGRRHIIEELQKDIPKFTFQMKKLCNELGRDAGALLENLKQTFEENVEIAAAWVLVSSAGIRGPYRSFSDRFENSDFTEAFGNHFKEWITLIRTHFANVVPTHDSDEFEHLLTDWFATGRRMMIEGGRFVTTAAIQTDALPEPRLELRAQEFSDSSSSFHPLLSRVESILDFTPTLTRSIIFTLCSIAPTLVTEMQSEASSEQFARTRSLLATASGPYNPLHDDGRARSATWMNTILPAFYDHRVQTMVTFDLGSSAIWHSPLSVENSIESYAHTKFGVKKMIKQFYLDFDSTILAMKDSNPAIFSMYQFKTGNWSSHCLDFYLMCRSKFPTAPRFDHSRFVEHIFSPFGRIPVESALGVVKLYNPAGREELLCCLATIFNSLVIGKRHESLAMFRSHCIGTTVPLQNFLSLCSSMSVIKDSKLAEQITRVFRKNEIVNLSLDEFEICTLYCGFFANPTLILQSDPFALLTDPIFDPIKAACGIGRPAPAIKELTHLIARMLSDTDLPEADSREVLPLLLRTAQISVRNKPRGFGATIAPPSRPGEPLPAPRRLRLRSELAAHFRTENDFLAALKTLPR
jgi:hypothetical protein